MAYRQKFLFSNMLPLDRPFSYQGIEFSYVETFYQATKVAKGDIELRRRIASMDPYEAKREGRRLARAGLVRPDFHAQKLAVMEFALRKKFSEGTTWRMRLMETGESPIVEENSWHDQVWGDCLCGVRESCKAPGENHLGRLLMKLRAEFRETCRHDYKPFDPSQTMLRCDGCFDHRPNPEAEAQLEAEAASAVMNLTGEVTTPTQLLAGVNVPLEEDGAVIRAMNKIEGAPSLEELSERADVLARLAQNLGFRRALVGGNLGFAVVLSDALRFYGIEPVRWERDGRLRTVPDLSASAA